MVEILKNMKKDYAVAGVKAEFEAEGTRTEELMRLKEVCLAAGVPLTLKIGGCEAIRDMYDARSIGVDYLVAPMIESPFALQKYLRAVDYVFPEDEQNEIEFLVNIETAKAARAFPDMLRIPEIKKLDGIVVGRVDMVGSMGLDRKSVNSDRIFSITLDLLEAAKAYNMTCVVGGAIATDSLPFLRKIKAGLLDRYETRKVCFLCPQALGDKAPQGIHNAVNFELLWLINKRDYYKSISQEDEKRITMLEERVSKGIVEQEKQVPVSPEMAARNIQACPKADN
jgi:4-hydroxy-2-oxoheptanedioate aldolase